MQLGNSDTVNALAARDKVGKLLKAAHDGDLPVFKDVEKQLANGPELTSALEHVKDANDRGPLHFAARGGKPEVLKYLVEELHLQVDPPDNEGETPLIHAARLGHTSSALYLLDHGADARAVAKDVDTSALHHAAGTGSLHLMEVLLDKGVDVDAPSSPGTPLIWAAGHGQAEAARLLLKRGANPDVTSEDGVTPLLTAVAAKFPLLVELLVENGANVNSVAGGVTPLHVAAEQGDEEIIRCLLGAGADPNATDHGETVPIQAAAAGGHRKVVEILLPLTSPIPSVTDWSLDGLMLQGEQLFGAEKAAYQREDTSGEAADNGNSKEEQVSTEAVSVERKQQALDAKARGTAAFKKGNFMDAVDFYTQGNELDPTNVEILSNRSLCWMRLGQAEQALLDAQTARKLAPQWPKAYYREGSALRLLQRFADAANAFYSGLQIAPDSMELVTAFKEAVDAGKKFHGVVESEAT